MFQPVFAVDRQADWQDFFQRYSEKPPREDDAGNESDVEDLQDEDQDEADDDPIFLPQPATPDLVKTTRKSQEKDSNGSWNSSPEERPRRPRMKRDQRRSYTTSIIINPGERTFVSVGQQKEKGDKPATDVTVDISKVGI